MLFSSKASYISKDTIYPAISLIDAHGKVNYCRLSISQDKKNKTNPLSHNLSLETPKRDNQNTSKVKIKDLQFKEEKLKNSRSLKLNIPLPKKANTKDNIIKVLTTPKKVNTNTPKKLIKNNSFSNIKELGSKNNAIEFIPVNDYLRLKQINTNQSVKKRIITPKLLINHPTFNKLFKHVK
jgi:hypothetical protein